MRRIFGLAIIGRQTICPDEQSLEGIQMHAREINTSTDMYPGVCIYIQEK